MPWKENPLLDGEYLKNAPELFVSFSLPGIPEIRPGGDIGKIIAASMDSLGGIIDLDIFVVASKIVSKSEGAIVDLSAITPSQRAYELSAFTGGRKSPQLCEVILNESTKLEVTRAIVATHKLGFQLTSAGVDRLDDKHAVILPADPDRSARMIMDSIHGHTGKKIAIVVSDSEGRSDREGAGAISIGVAGINPLRVLERVELDGQVRKTSETVADLLAASAALQMGQRGKNTPVVCIRGFNYDYDPEASLGSIIYQSEVSRQ
jgi:coenzyme F420-0:L-glutamate ligase/coenzyme F420-1:gamma-L-glutamate ligase